MNHYFHLPRHASHSNPPIYYPRLIDGFFVSLFLLVLCYIMLSTSSSFYLFSYNSWQIRIDFIGFLFPALLCLYLLMKTSIDLKSILFGIAAVSIMAYFITTPVLEKGIISPFPFSLFPAIIGSIISIKFLSNKNKINRFVFSYSISIFGVFVGADLFHLPSLLIQTPDSPMYATIGGAGLFDLICISGLISCFILLMYDLVNSTFLFNSQDEMHDLKITIDE